MRAPVPAHARGLADLVTTESYLVVANLLVLRLLSSQYPTG